MTCIVGDMAGRPTKYKKEYDQLAYNYALLGATDETMAGYFEVTVKTFNNWKHDHPTFLQSLKAGKADSDAFVAKSLFGRATGFTKKETKLAQVDGQFTDSKEIDVEVIPDVTACIFWLKNRQPDLWRDRVETKQDITTTNTSVVFVPEPAESIEDWEKMVEEEEQDEEDDKNDDGKA